MENNGPMTFAATGVEGGGKGLLVTGDLSIKGVTKSVVLDVEVLGSESDPWGGTRVGFEGTTRSPARSSASTSTSPSTAAA